MPSNLDLFGLADPLPDGLTPGTDSGALVTGRLLGLDIPRGLAQVSVGGSDGLWVPADPAIYPPDALVRLLRSPLDGGRITMCLGPLSPGAELAWGRVVSVNAAVGLLKVAVLGTEVDLPYNPGTYNAGTWVHVLRAPSRFGTPYFVSGPSGNYNGDSPGTPGGGASNPGSLVTRTATIVPAWSGSWRSRFSTWDQWNTNRYGGRSTLWQGDGFGSGPMTGLAVYGERVVSLGAAEILSIGVSVYRADSSDNIAKAAVLQPSPHGSFPGGAPVISPAAAVATPGLLPNGGAFVMLPASVLEGFRTGAFKGLATVGSAYAGFSGTPERAPVHADGMALSVTYTVLQ
ncbi:hypothetical protein [Microbacterium sp. NPDC089696]|uniref:hypothetical protein n=1 Tax=Microbacterium sp. NPDC089696 TaxID=3364199 RepID=UPI0037F46467